MISSSQNDEYFERMSSSLGDKQKIVDYLIPGIVLDVGSGGGDLAETIRLYGHEVYAIDGSETALKQCQKNFPNVHTVFSMVGDLRNHFSDHSIQNIVCSSILHEVFSYGDCGEPAYQLSTVEKVLQIFHRLLVPGGRLIIRDGVMPDNHSESGYIRFSGDGMDFLDYYSSHAPFWLRNENNAYHVFLEKCSDNLVTGNMNSIMEFLYTYTWGWASAPRETQEIYGIATEESYMKLLHDNHFSNIYHEQYTQQGYVDHLTPLVKIYDKNFNTASFPSTNMIIVSEN